MDPRADDPRRPRRRGARVRRRLSTEPRLSLVAALRNEQYGGDLFARARAMLRNVAWIDPTIEVVFVEWCPLPDAPPLADALVGLPVRIVTVPSELAAERFARADEIAQWIYTAKNVGIRRARAPFVLATNPDVLFTPGLLRGPFDERSFYRVSRRDVAGVPLDAAPDEQLAHARRSVVRVNMRAGSVRGGALARLLHELRRRRLAPRTAAERAARPTEWLHTNASGDFLLMHRDRWRDLHGYPEFPSAGHLDSYGVALAAAAGLRQVILRAPLYHLEHERAIDWERPETAQHDYVPYATFVEHVRPMLLAGRAAPFNDEHWGIGDVDLPETRLQSAP